MKLASLAAIAALIPLAIQFEPTAGQADTPMAALSRTDGAEVSAAASEPAVMARAALITACALPEATAESADEDVAPIGSTPTGEVTAEGESLRAYPVYFRAHSAELTDESRIALAAVADEITIVGLQNVTVHAPDRARGQTILETLMAFGVPERWVRVESPHTAPVTGVQTPDEIRPASRAFDI